MAKEIKKNSDESRSVGRRKCAAARVKISKGKGEVVINGQPMKEYFNFESWQEELMAPLKLVAKDKDLDVSVKVVGGGKKGQVVAVRHGIARALVLWNEDFRKTMKTAGFLTRDSRVKERKKPGLKKARRAPQWRKR